MGQEQILSPTYVRQAWHGTRKVTIASQTDDAEQSRKLTLKINENFGGFPFERDGITWMANIGRR